MFATSSSTPTNTWERIAAWVTWVFLSGVSVLAGFHLAYTVGDFSDDAGYPLSGRAIALLMIQIISLLLGLGQGLVVRKYLHRAVWWVVATWLGCDLSLVLVALPIINIGISTPYLEMVIIAVSIGLGVGIAQALVLNVSLHWRATWVGVSLAGWLLLAATLPLPIAEWRDLVWVGLAPALVTGTAWVWGIGDKTRQAGT